MADLDGRSRGQIIFVAAFALAVIFITLALIVNSAIFTQNLASRGETAGGDDALSHRAMVEASVGDGIEIANRQNNSGDLGAAVNDSIDNITTQSERQQVTSGALVKVTKPTSITEGTRVVQNESVPRNFSSKGGGSDKWTVLEGIERTPGHNGTRAFRMNITELDSSTPFVVTANGTGSSRKWTMEIEKDSSGPVTDGDQITVTVDPPKLAGSPDCTIEVGKDFAVIDVTAGTINGEPCAALRRSSSDSRFARGVGSEYNVTFDNGDRVEGGYTLTANRDYTTVESESSTLNTSNTNSPYATKAIYNVTVGYTYETSDFRYNTTIRVAPGEPDV